LKSKTKKSGLLNQKAGQKYKKAGQKQIVLNYIIKNPMKNTVRTIAAKTKLPKSTVQYYLQQFKEEKLISKENQWLDTWENRIHKQHLFVHKLINSGLIEYLEEELAPSSIILFGSFAKGEYVQESDIDIFVEGARKKKLSLVKYEKKLNHKIDLFVENSIDKVPKNLRNNIVNGTVIRGYLTIWN
jgi:predicted nucleotidyltransferase